MTEYLQRLLDSALPASEPPALAPVVRSASPVFEQNQLLGLPGFQAGEMDAQTTPPVSDPPRPQDPKAPVPPFAPSPIEMTRHGPRPATPASMPDAENRRSMAVDSPTPRPTAADLIAPPPQARFERVLEPARPAPEIVKATPRLETPDMESATDLPWTPVLQEVAFGPARIAGPIHETIPPVAAEAAAQRRADPSPAAPQVVTRDVLRPLEGDAPRALEPGERAPDASPPPSMLEPRPRPDFRDVEPEADQPEINAPQVPKITIGRVTVELVPDPAPVARPAVTSRTAAAASVIGPLGNRRMRRRLFALSRL